MGIWQWLFGKPPRKPRSRTAHQSKSPLEKTKKPEIIIPERRSSGAFETHIKTPYIDFEAGREHIGWTSLLIPDGYLAIRRPNGAVPFDWAAMIEIRATGKPAENFNEGFYYDLLSDIEEAGRTDLEDDEEHTFMQDLILRKSAGRLAVLRRFYEGRTATIGHLPDEVAQRIDSDQVKISDIGVEIVEARMAEFETGRTLRHMATFSVNLLDLRQASKGKG